jgi:hypothetical protein
MSTRHAGNLLRSAILAGFLVGSGFGVAQQAARPADSSPESSLSDSVRELRQQIRELQTAVADIRSEAQQYRAETMELRRELEAVRAATGSPGPAAESPAPAGVAAYGAAAGTAPAETQAEQKKLQHAASLEEQYQLLSGKVDEQYQTKVESASKYRVRLSGIVLLNLFSNVGTVDNMDIPSLALVTPRGSSNGSFGATLRQSEIGLEVFGPHVAGARTKADLQLDLGGGFPVTPYGVNTGLLRLRTATMRLDWAHTSIVAGQDGLFFSPASPTSFASLAIPAFSYTGNLWAWVPQVRVERRWSVGEGSSLLLQGGILDPLNGEPPVLNSYRQPDAGEMSRQPAYATRVSWGRSIFGQPLRVGVGGYYSRQDYGFERTVDAWAGMSDWDIPLGHQLSLSGKLYRGRGLGGLGGGIGRSVLFSGDPALADTAVRALNSVGGWAQLKYRPAPKLEFNGAFGQDNPYAADVRAFSSPQAYANATLVKNRGTSANLIYRPRSDLLFSVEYRHMNTYTIDNVRYTADHINLMMGVLF